MKTLHPLFLVFLMSWFAPELSAQVTKPIGVNVSYVSDYATEFVFTDVFKQCRVWIPCNADDSGPWDSQVSIPLRPDGYPLEIPYNDGINPPQKIKTLIVWELGDAMPQGTYRFISSGTGQIELKNGAWGIYNSPIDTLLTLTGSTIVEIIQSNVMDPVHAIKFILPDYVNSYQTKPYTDLFLNYIKDFQVIRFMDFLLTNEGSIEHWEDRTPYDNYTQAARTGVAWEYIIDLANQTQADCWINIPHKVDDAYIDSLAHLFLNQLDPSRKIYIEYSNEIWNGGYIQHYECSEMGLNEGFTGTEWELAFKYTVKRSADIFRIFESVFGSDARLVKIIPVQAANSWLTNELVTMFNDPIYNPTQVTADAIALAPYFGIWVADEIVANGQVSSITIPEILQLLEDAIPEVQDWIIANKLVADNHGLQLITYEGGQHLVATGENMNNDTLTEKLMAANHDPAIQAIYCDYLDFWYSTSGSLFTHFSSVQRYSKYGSWGLMETYQDSLNPKYQALKECVFADNHIQINSPESPENIQVYPNPGDGIFYIESKLQDIKFKVYSIQGQLITHGKGSTIDLSRYPGGIYSVDVNGKRVKIVRL